MPVEAFWWIGFLVGLLGVALTAGALFIRGRPRGRLRCRKCWYDMAGARTDADGSRTCPECGRTIVHERHLLRTRRYWRLALLGLLVMGAGAGTSAWPMLSAKHWQRFAPSAVLVWIANAGEPATTDETWKELATRAKYDQLAKWQRGMLAEKLGEGLVGFSTVKADEHVNLICLLRPPPSEALALELVAYGVFLERVQDDLAESNAKYRATVPDRAFVNYGMEPWDALVRYRQVLEALGYAGTDVGSKELVRVFQRSASWTESRVVAPPLARIGDERAIAALCDRLLVNPEDPATILAIASIGTRAREQAAPVLESILDAVRPHYRGYVELCLAVLHGEIADVSIPLAHLISGDYETTNTLAGVQTTFTFLRLSPQFDPGSPGHPELAVPVLLEYLGSHDSRTRNTACELLQAIGPKARPALPALESLLNDPEVVNRAQSAIDAIRRPD